jgi:hypothetical protein
MAADVRHWTFGSDENRYGIGDPRRAALPAGRQNTPKINAEPSTIRRDGRPHPGRALSPLGTVPACRTLVSRIARRGLATGVLAVESNARFFRVWAHRHSASIFGAASSPVIRNGAYLCFDSEQSAQMECDRLNARRSDMQVRYSVEPTHIEALLPQAATKRSPVEAPSFSALATAPCFASNRQARAPRGA